MSTRCNIIVMTEDKIHQFYHHCDGYPEGVGLELVATAQVAELITEYHYANFNRIYSDKLSQNFFELLGKMNQYEDEGEIPLITRSMIHGDIDYLYIVRIKEDGIEVMFKEWNNEWEDDEAIKHINLMNDDSYFKNLSIGVKLR